jgi:succinylglutamic semialdehyde dehydrogenase
MNKAELKQLLDAEAFDPKVYSLDGGLPNDRLCLSAEDGNWHVYYSERGSRFDEQCYSSEDEACRDLLGRLRQLPPAQTGTGAALVSTNPATGEVLWRGAEATQDEVQSAVTAARDAFTLWSSTNLEDRITKLKALEDRFRADKPKFADAIAAETGKPLWEALTEVDAMAAKIPISIEAYRERCAEVVRSLPGAKGVTRFHPHGVLAVFGPFNMPGHLPNGHIIPALLAGNTIVFKPSEQTPAVGGLYAQAIESAGFPTGVFNLIQGGRETGRFLAENKGINGLLFTGSLRGGQALSTLLANDPSKILALELGGNNPLIIHEISDLSAAAYLTIQSAFITSGQRCSCARRLILVRGDESEDLQRRLRDMIEKIRVGIYTDRPEPFMGPLISRQAAEELLRVQRELIHHGSRVLVEMKQTPRSPALLTPGLIDVTPIDHRPDAEFFGPLLQIIQVDTFDQALAEANNTAYGLSAGLISNNPENYEKFIRAIRAGVVSWNRPMTGASSQLPFGGIGLSGNHRPSGYFAVDYTAYPVAALESPRAELPEKLPPGITV